MNESVRTTSRYNSLIISTPKKRLMIVVIRKGKGAKASISTKVSPMARYMPNDIQFYHPSHARRRRL